MYSIRLLDIKDDFVQIKLFDDKNINISQSDNNIYKPIFDGIDLNKISQEAADFLYNYQKNGNKITGNLLYNIFAYFWVLENSDGIKQEFENFCSGFKFNLAAGELDGLIKYGFEPNAASRIYFVWFGRFMNLSQFKGSEGYYNASSKLISLKDKYLACESDIYLDGLYYKQIDRLDDNESDDYQLLKQFKGFSETNKDNIYNWIMDIFASKEFADFITRKSIDTICVIPNNSERPVSTNQIIYDTVKSNYPSNIYISITKNKLEKQIAQKNIRIFCDRIINANKLFDVDVNSMYNDCKNILLIDDVFGSGATMNVISSKIKKLKPNVNIIGFAILGSYRTGFDIINEA